MYFASFSINFALKTTIKLYTTMKETKSKQAKAETESKSQGLKNITKSSVWDIQENDVFRLINSGLKDSEAKENLRHYIDIFRAAFMIEEVKGEGAHVKKAYEKQGYKVGNIALDDDTKVLWAVRKRPIMRVTDLTYENIRHISASKLIEVLDRNFGGGWDSLSQSIQDIFAKVKPEMIKPRLKLESEDDIDEDDEDADVIVKDTYVSHDEEDDIAEFPEDEMTEDNYRTTFDIESDPDEEVSELAEYGSDE